MQRTEWLYDWCNVSKCETDVSVSWFYSKLYMLQYSVRKVSDFFFLQNPGGYQ